MNDINVVTITGNLTRDAELRATRSGVSILNFRIASNYGVKNKQTGEWEDRANFVGCAVVGARAEPLSKMLAKGSKVAVSGSLRYHEWEDEHGNKRSALEVYADEVVVLTPKRDGSGGGGYQQATQQTPQQPQSAPSQGYPMYDRDIPF